ncbi:hydrocephalus-inducing protein-like, partial [Pyxicephalus adspersus]|uniref:hydrocephalus-inducing protein-like n=1 Tax=Pyxicephalus adspersus TaxID=30357 RepID=UPI003B597FE9
ATEETEDKQTLDTSDLSVPQRVPSTTSYGESRSSHAEAQAEDAEEDSEKKAAPSNNVSGTDGTRKAVGELELNPVSQAVARYMGIDTSSEGQAARNRRGIAIIVHGAPLTGKTSTALALAQHYSVACLSIDSVVLEAISNGNSRASLRARELCAKAAINQSLREAEEAASQAVDIPSGHPALSIEAVAKHTAEGGQGAEVRVAPQSVVSRANQASLQTGKGKAEKHQHPTDLPMSLAGSSPLPGPSQRRLSVSASVAGEQGLMSCVLPDDLLIEILSDRLQ